MFYTLLCNGNVLLITFIVRLMKQQTWRTVVVLGTVQTENGRQPCSAAWV